jgi:MscS family membrane protein
MNVLDQLPILDSLPAEIRPIAVQLVLLVIALFVIWVLRRAIRWLIFRPLRRAVETSASPLAAVIYDALQRPSQLIVFSLGIYVTLALFEFGTGAEAFATLVARAVLLIAAFVTLYGVVDVVFANVTTLDDILGLSIETRLLPFLRTVLKVVVITIGALIVLQEFGVDITALIASFGVVGLALSLAAQDTAANVFSFAAIVSDNPFKVGDYVKVGDIEGEIEAVGVRSTKIRQLNQSLVILPNSEMTNTAVINWSRLTKRWIDVTFNVENDTTSAQMRDLLARLRQMLLKRSKVEPNTVSVHFIGFKEETLEVRLRCYVRLRGFEEWITERDAINLSVLEILEELGIFLALPDRVVMHVRDAEDRVTVEGEHQPLKRVRAEDDPKSLRRMRSTSELRALRAPQQPVQPTPSQSDDGGDQAEGED